MAEENTLDSILSDEPPPQAAEPSADDQAKMAAEQERVVKGQSLRREHQDKEYTARGLERDEHGQWKKREAAPAEEPAPKIEEKPAAASPPPQPEMTAREKAAFAKAADEARKRQGLEAELAALRAAKPPEQPKAFWDDPEAALKAQKDEFSAALVNTRLNTAETIARSKYTDFDEKAQFFKEYLEGQNPAIAQSIAQRWLASPDPAQFVYEFSKTQQELKEAGDLPAMRAKIEAEAYAKGRAAAEAEYKAKMDADAKTRAALPRSLSDARGSNPIAPVWSGPESLDDILK